MMNHLALITPLLCWISVSVAEFHTVDVQPGEDVTLLCSNFSSITSHVLWFKLDNRSNISCISSMVISDNNVSFCDGFRNGKFNMTSNSTTLFLEIKQADLSDSGLYFCGFNSTGKPVIVSATYLKVQGLFDGIRVRSEVTRDKVLYRESGVTMSPVENPDGRTSLTSVILAAAIVFLITVVIGMTLKINKLLTADNEEQDPQRSENLDSDVLTDTTVSLYSPTIRNRRPASEREVETCVVYTASR